MIMAFPASLTTVIVTGRWLNLDQSPATGSVSFIGKFTLSNLVDDTFVIIDRIDVDLDAQGQISVTLPVADDPDWTPTGWTYAVIERISDRPADRAYDFLLSTVDAPSVDLTQVVPVPPVTPPNLYIPLSQKGAAGGVATLDNTGNVPLSQLGNSPGGAGIPSSTVVTEQSFGQGSAAGAATTYSRGDHTHGTPNTPAIPAPGSTVVTEQSFGQSSSAGTGTAFSRLDHTHGTPTAPSIPAPASTVVTEQAFGQASTAGTGTAYSRNDHTHGTPTAPAVPGPGGTVVTEQAFGQASSAGSGATFSRSDHTHGTPAAPAVPAASGTVANATTFGISPAAGSAATFSRGDHQHGTPATPAGGSGVDAAAARIGLLAVSFPPECASEPGGAPLNAGVFVTEPVYLSGTPIARLGCWLSAFGASPSGVNVMSLYTAAGVLVDSTADMTTAFTSTAGLYITGLLSAGSFTPTPGIYIVSILTNLGTAPKVAATGNLPNVPFINGMSVGGFFTGVSTPPASFSPATLNPNNGGYFIGVQ